MNPLLLNTGINNVIHSVIVQIIRLIVFAIFVKSKRARTLLFLRFHCGKISKCRKWSFKNIFTIFSLNLEK